MPIEMAVAGFEANTTFMKRNIHAISDETIAACKDKTVILFGTYWTPESVAALVSSAASVTSVVYDATCTKYAPLESVSLTHLELRTVLPQLNWAQYGVVYNALLRRGKTHPGGTQTDELLYRGMELAGKKAGQDLEHFCRANRDLLFHTEQRAFVEMGKLIVLTDTERAESTAREHGVEVTVDGKRAWLVHGPWTPVQPYTEAAALVAAEKGCALGLNMRISLAKGITAFSAIPVAGQDPDITKFMTDKDSFDGGGPPQGRGASVPGFIQQPIVEDLKHVVQRNRQVANAATTVAAP